MRLINHMKPFCSLATEVVFFSAIHWGCQKSHHILYLTVAHGESFVTATMLKTAFVQSLNAEVKLMSIRIQHY